MKNPFIATFTLTFTFELKNYCCYRRQSRALAADGSYCPSTATLHLVKSGQSKFSPAVGGGHPKRSPRKLPPEA